MTSKAERLKGHVAIVTGVSRPLGIGTAICRTLAQDGADVLFTHWRAYDRTMEWGAAEHWPEKLCEELRASGVKAEHLEIDMSSPDSPYRILDTAAGKLGNPTVLVNNAAHSTRDGYQQLSADILDAHYAVNVRAACLLSAVFAQRFDPSSGGGGRIINMVSGQDKGPMPGELAYVASKGAISAFTVSLAAEVAPLNITVNAVDPGPTDSGWMTDELKTLLRPKFPMGRLGRPEDAARLVAFLASSEAEWITGQIIHSDGGFRD
ncbi:SDR family oxidoreductase [Paenibacillus sp. NPDC056579]|uniref:SDR family oxidoreductase n=1 Tax=Paenibacillus sp. NPDC056579 TaxID=3345871 RepID=UPI0036BF4A2F